MASRRIFLDIEEALSRQVRRILHHDLRTADKTILQETYDPFSGEVIKVPIEAEFYDSSADAGGVYYPHFFIRLLRTREDLTSGRVVPQYGQWLRSPLSFSPGAYEIVLPGNTGIIPVVGNRITVSTYQIRKVQVGFLLRILNGNNIGTYTVTSITVNSNGDHFIDVSNTLVSNIPAFEFNTSTRVVQFDNIDIHTVKVGDIFKDSSLVDYPILAVDAAKGQITLDGSTTPSLALGGLIYRVGDVFQNTDLSNVRFIVMDPSKPVEVATVCGPASGTSGTVGVTPPIPIDAYYLVRIDSKTRENHIDVLNRVWEEFNPPRTALPTIARSALSAEQELTADVTSGGSNTVQVTDSSKFNVGETVFLFDDLHPVLAPSGLAEERPFEAKIIDIPSATSIVFDRLIPDTFTVENSAKMVSHAEYRLFYFQFVDHVTKDVEGSQYWVHELQFWVQTWVDRFEDPSTLGPVPVVLDIALPIEDLDGNVIIDDN